MIIKLKMSQMIKVSSLTEAQREALIRELTFVEKQEKSFNDRQGYRRQGKPVLGFVRDIHVESDTGSEGDHDLLRIPFSKGKALFKTNNDRREFQSAEFVKRDEEDLSDDQKVNASKIATKLNQERTALLCLGAGGGKTATTCVIATKIKLLTVVLIQNKTLSGQWKKEFEKFTTAKVHIVDKKTRIPSNAQVLICHVRRFRLIEREIRDRVGLLVIDEAHLHCNQMCVDAMLAFTPKYIISLTATPSRSRNGMFTVMEAFVGKNEVVDKRKKDISVTMIKTGYKATIVKDTRGIVIWSTYIQSLIYNMERNLLIVSSIMNDATTGRKIMVLTTEKKHVEILHELIQEAGGDSDTLSGKKQSYNNCQILVGNIQKCGVGFDDANFCSDFDGEKISIIWIVSQIGNKEMAEQVIGRARDDYPHIRHVVDDERLSTKHWQICRKVYIERGGKVSYVKWD